MGHDAQVAGQRYHRAGSRRGAVDGGDHRFLQLAQIGDELAGHARKSQELGRWHLKQRTDDFMDAAATAKATPFARQHHGAHRRFIAQSQKHVAELAIDLKAQRIEGFGTI